MPSLKLASKLSFAIAPILAYVLTSASITSQAATVVLTITGTAEGGDQYDIFHVGGRFKDQDFTLVFTFDDNVNPEKSRKGSCPDFYVKNSGSSSSSPVTAVLSIGSGSFTFGEDPTGNWAITRCTNGELFVSVNEGIYPHIEGFNLRIRPAEGKPAIGQSLDWKSPLAKIEIEPAAERVLINHPNDFERITEAFLRLKSVDAQVQGAQAPIPITPVTEGSCGDTTIPADPQEPIPHRVDTNLPKLDPSNPNYHHYKLDHIICFKSSTCTMKLVFQGLLRNAAPGQTDVAFTGNKVNVLFLGKSAGTITQVVAPSSCSVYNITDPGHIFYPGYVQRSVVTEKGFVMIQTIGEGIGKDPLFNRGIASPAFTYQDLLIKNYVLTNGGQFRAR